MAPARRAYLEKQVEPLAQKFYAARPAGSGIARTGRGGLIASETFSWEDAQEDAAPYVSDLRTFARIALNLPADDAQGAKP